LGDHHLVERTPLLLQGRIRREITGRRQHARLEGGTGTRVGPQHLTRIRPRRTDSLCVQERGTQGSREQFAHGHYARAKSIAHLTAAGRRIRHVAQLLHEAFEERARHYAQCARKIAMLGIDLLENQRVRTARGRREQRLEAIRDAGECRVNDYRSEGGSDPGPDYVRDIVPIGDGGHAGSPEFEHDPGSIIFRHSKCRTCDFDSAAPNRNSR